MSSHFGATYPDFVSSGGEQWLTFRTLCFETFCIVTMMCAVCVASGEGYTRIYIHGVWTR